MPDPNARTNSGHVHYHRLAHRDRYLGRNPIQQDGHLFFQALHTARKPVGCMPADSHARKLILAACNRENTKSMSTYYACLKLADSALKQQVNKTKRLVLIDCGKPSESIYGDAYAQGIQIIATIAKQKGFSTEVFHLNRDNWNDIKNRLKPGDILGLSSTSPGHINGMNFLDHLGTRLLENLLVIKGGVHEKTAGDYLQFVNRDQRYPVDFSFVSDADKSFRAFLDIYNEAHTLTQAQITEKLQNIQGLVFRGKHKTRKLKLPIDQQVLPSPQNYELLEPFTIFRNPEPDHKMIRVMDMRGCPEHCTFCAIPNMTTRQPARTIVEHLKQVINTGLEQGKEIGCVMFEDATFMTRAKHDKLINQEISAATFKMDSWLDEFIAAMTEFNTEFKAEHGYKIQFAIQTRADSLKDDQLLARLQKAGLAGVYIGVESLNDDTLKSVGKGTHATTNTSAIEHCHRNNIDVTASTIIEVNQEQDTLDTISRLMDLGVNEIFTEYRKVYPNTPDANRVYGKNGEKLTPIDVLNAYNDGTYNKTEGGNEDKYNLIVRAEGNKLIVVSDEELFRSSKDVFQKLKALSQEKGYEVLADGHYRKLKNPA
ncbi:MAG: hypothetical protein RLZZ361_372 [Cyanobacteriota bacterium]